MAMVCCLSLVECFRSYLTSLRDSRSLRCPSGFGLLVPSTAASAAAESEDRDGRSAEGRYRSEDSSSNSRRGRSVLLEGVLHKLVRHVDILETKRKHDSEARKVRYSMFIAFADIAQCLSYLIFGCHALDYRRLHLFYCAMHIVMSSGQDLERKHRDREDALSAEVQRLSDEVQ